MAALVTDFVRNDGTYMVINTEEGLHTEHLNRVQRNMLTSVTIPNLLPLEVREIDFEVTLYYEITGKRMLAQCLKSDQMTMTEFYSLLLQIMKVLDHSKEYMLTIGNYLLDENHIFIEESLSSGMVYLVYLPLLDISRKQSIAQALLTLVNRLMTRVTDMEGSGIQQIISLCGGELFSVTGLKSLLISLLLDEAPPAPPVGHGTILGPSEGGGGRAPFSHEQSRSSLNDPYLLLAENLPSRSKMNFSSDAIDRSDTHFRGAIGEEEADGENEQPEVSRVEIKPTYLWLSAVLLGMVVWKFGYMDKPTDAGLYISAGVSVAIIIFVLLINRRIIDLAGLFRNKNGQKWNGDSHQEESEAYLEPKKGRSDRDHNDHKDNRNNPGSRFGSNLHRYEEKWRWNESLIKADSQSQSLLEKQAESDRDLMFEELPVTIKEPYPASSAESAVRKEPVASASATVLLKDFSESEQLQARNAAYYLEKQLPLGIGAERIPLPKGSFIIGRSEDLAQYVEKGAGVSRAHVELMIREASFSIKDLGSRNGTKLNGELIAPYKDYSMEPGDSFSIAEITFHLGRNH
ncbi:DUF6382 domain-containing protein [Paenibacillus lentus]|uniref:FHA domain-containing protein n=1 Tax=Paenibacillus lentus TaxID=1338368 RepID=A0A3S8RZE4_9BACL|nr:DUF6382 domain-containing protein [Paenibacillus lentus]AZK48311.1 FHA domain-containing protein [Paenibacillus lentus]